MRKIISFMFVLLITGLLSTGTIFAQSTTAYDNTTGFTGFGLAVGVSGTTAQGAVTITSMFTDNITLYPTVGGATATQVTFFVGNFGANTVTARPRVRFYADDNGGTAPGSFITGFSFNPISFTAGNVSGLFFNPGASLIIPANARLWAGILFDNQGATATATDLQSFGVGIFNGFTVGSSTDAYFLSPAPASGSYLVTNPAGSAQTTTTPNNGSFGWQFQTAIVIPEPTTWALIGLSGLVAGAAYRRIRKSNARVLNQTLTQAIDGNR